MIIILIKILGLIGILIISFSGIPQLIKVVKTHSVNDLSLVFFTMLLVGMILLLIYSFSIENTVYIVGNIISLIMTIGIIICILKWK